MKRVYQFCSIGSANTGTLLSSKNCPPAILLHNAIMPGITRVDLSAGLKLAKCFVLSGPLCQQGTCVVWKVSFPSSNDSLMSVLSAVNFMKLSGFRTVSYTTTVPLITFISFKNRLCVALVRRST